MLSPGLAVFLALTGYRSNTGDLLYTGLATHYIPSKNLQRLKHELMMRAFCSREAQPSSTTLSSSSSSLRTIDDVITPILESFHQPQPVNSLPWYLARHHDTIERVLGVIESQETVEDIIVWLQALSSSNNADGRYFSRQTIKTLVRMSPTSLKVTFEALRRGRELTNIADALTMEYRIGQRLMRHHYPCHHDRSDYADGISQQQQHYGDFHEGVRAALKMDQKEGDDARQPHWQPSKLEEVSDEMVQRYFAPLSSEWEPPHQQPSSTTADVAGAGAVLRTSRSGGQ